MLKVKPLLINLLIPLAVGGLSALLIRDDTGLYAELRQPPLSPPGWAFPAVWTALYLLMGLAAYLVWMRDSTGRAGALCFYGLQLCFNFVWCLLFFRLRCFGFSLFCLAVLWILLLFTTVRFFQERRAAGWLLLPALLWTAFAGYLNAGILFLN